MSKGLNRVQIIGHLGQDPELRYTSGEKAVVNFTVASKAKWGDKEQVEWQRLVAWERLAEIIDQYLKKGSLAFFEGSLRTRKYQHQDGSERAITEIRVREMIMLSPKGDRPATSKPEAPVADSVDQAEGGSGGEGPFDSIPFAPVD